MPSANSSAWAYRRIRDAACDSRAEVSYTAGMTETHETIRAALAARTPGDWDFDGVAIWGDDWAGVCREFKRDEDAHLITNAPTWLADLLEENKQLHELISDNGRTFYVWDEEIKSLTAEVARLKAEQLAFLEDVAAL